MSVICNIPTLSVPIHCCEPVEAPRINPKNPYLKNVKFDFTLIVEYTEKVKEDFKDEVVYYYRRGNYIYLKGGKGRYKILVEDAALIEQFKKIKTLNIVVK